MSERESGYARKERDLYETPEWVTEALLQHLPPPKAIWEPACGSGQMCRVLARVAEVVGSDIEPAEGFLQVDFLNSLGRISRPVHAIITNPPYETATQFCEVALQKMEECTGMVAMLSRSRL